MRPDERTGPGRPGVAISQPSQWSQPHRSAATVPYARDDPAREDGHMGKHLLDTTPEFSLPPLARHAAEDDQHETTQRFDAGFGQQPRRPEVPREPAAR